MDYALSDFIRQDKIGSGSFGKVYKVKDIKTGKIMAAKIFIDEIMENSRKQLQDIKREVNILSKFSHPSILKFIFYSPYDFKQKLRPVIVTEFAENGSLESFIKNSKIDDLNMTQKLIIIYGISIAMSYLNKNGVIHRDLKTGNILLDEFFFPKVADFGLSKSRKMEESTTINEIKGTPSYISPEIWNNAEYSESSDVYAFSLIVYELLTYLKPFNNLNFFALQLQVTKGYRPNLNIQKIPESYSNLIRDCWEQDPDKRPSFDQIIDRLLNDRGFITENVNETEFLNYIKYINEYGSSFNRKREVFYFDPCNKRVKIIEILEYSPLILINNMSLFPNIEYSKLDEKTKKIIISANKNPEKKFNVAISLIEGREHFPQNTQIGIKYLRKSFNKDFIKPIVYYCEMLIKGKIIPQDLNKAMKIAQKKLVNQEALYSLIMGKIEKKMKDYEKAKFFLEKSIYEGNDESMYEYGKMLYNGNGLLVNKEKAIEYYIKAIEKGNVKAMLRYGKIMKEEKNNEEGNKLIKKSADEGYSKACYYYSIMLENGDGIEVNKKESVYYLKKAVKNRHVESMCKYGIELSKDPNSLEESLLFLKESSNRGNIKSMYHYSMTLLKGEKIQENTKEALKYLKMAAFNGNIDAMIKYADIFRIGDYAPFNKEEALKFYKMAIERGNEYAMNIYADMIQQEEKTNKIMESSSAKPPKVNIPKVSNPPKVNIPEVGNPPKVNIPKVGNPPKVNISEVNQPPKVNIPKVGNPPKVNIPKVGKPPKVNIPKVDQPLKVGKPPKVNQPPKVNIPEVNQPPKVNIPKVDQPLKVGKPPKVNIPKLGKPPKIKPTNDNERLITSMNNVDISCLRVVNGHEAGIYTEKVQPHVASFGKYTDMFQQEEITSEVIELSNTKTSEEEEEEQQQTYKYIYTPSFYNDEPILQIKNGNEACIYTERVEQCVASVGKYLFYFTGGDKDMLLKGIEVDLDTSYDSNQCNEHLLTIIQDFVDIKDKQLLVYLPGGIPFNSGTLEKFTNNKIIYGVLARNLPKSIINASYTELCNIRKYKSKQLISPLVNSSDLGLSDMACLLGYLNHGGLESDLLLRTCATVIHFPPLITSMYKIIDKSEVFGYDIINVTSTLYTFFRAYIPPLCPNNKVFEYALRMCNLISQINDVPDKIPLLRFELIPGVVHNDLRLFYDMNLDPIVYLWKGDTSEQFQWFELKIQSEKAIENAYNVIDSFRPIEPLSTRHQESCSIVKGKDHEYLYLSKTIQEKSESFDIKIINPMVGTSETIDAVEFAKKQYRLGFNNTSNLINSDQVKQIIMIDFDESKSMLADLDGYFIPEKSDDYHRITVACQYLATFTSKIYGYNIKCIQGLISFNSTINIRCPLCPLFPDFYDKVVKSIQPKSITKLWDSLHLCCKEIVKFRKDSKGNELYKNAISRIFVISDGDDINSSETVSDVVKELLINKIIVDSIIISNEDECKMLCAVCHITGGLSFCPKTVNEGLKFIEKSAFLNYEERHFDRRTIPDMINENFMKIARDNAKFDEDVQNKIILQAFSNDHLATPQHICSKNIDSIIPSPRQRRILCDLNELMKVNDPNNEDYYDPDMKIFTFQTNIEKWKVFLKGPEGTPYESKWWFLYVTFPVLYPSEPPDFRFVTVPYHLNVSDDGRICLDIIQNGYKSSKNIWNIIQEIKELFLLPSTDTPGRLEAYNMFMNDRFQYDKLARESSQNAKDNFKDYITDSLVLDDVPNDINLNFNPKKHFPHYMLAQVSREKLQKDKMILASSGVYYDKDELKKIISSNQNPVCAITGKILTEKPEDLENSKDITDQI